MLVGAGGRDPLVQLVGFATTDRPPGTVVDEVEAAGIGVRSDQQVGAIQWDRTSGVIAQLFIQRSARGQGLARVLAYAASGVHQFHGWPGAIRSNQRRTALGERFVQALGHPERIPPLTEPAPPMDRPPGACAQVQPCRGHREDRTAAPSKSRSRPHDHRCRQ